MRLQAGPVSVDLVGAELMNLRLGRHELARRVHFVVRDEHWGTVGPEVLTIRISEGREKFGVALEVLHRQGPVAVRWTGRIDGAPDGCITFSVDTEALDTFPYGRIGLCVLHRAIDYVGRRYVASRDGLARSGVFSPEVLPVLYRAGVWEPVVGPFTSLAIELADAVTVDFAFEGGLFEMEDQRNWTDATLKTYSTPIAKDHPHWATPATRLRHGLAIRVPSNVSAKPEGASLEERITAHIGVDADMTLPELGTLMTDDPTPAAPGAAELMSAAGLDYLRVDVETDETAARAALVAAAAFARLAGAELEIAFHIAGSDPMSVLPLIRSVADDVGVRRVLILDVESEVTGPDLLRSVRRELAGMPQLPALGGGTALWFAEINRERPDYRVADFVAFGLSPQLHTFDDQSIMDSLESQALVVRAARRLCRAPAVVVGPVVLRPGVEQRAGTLLHGGVDPRQHTMFCAAWTVGSYAQLARGRAAAVTYYDALGPCGLVATCGRTTRMSPGLWAVSELHRLKAGTPLAVATDSPTKIAHLASRVGCEVRVVVANLTSFGLTVSLSGVVPEEIAVRTYDRGSADEGRDPSTTTEREVTRSPGLEVELRAYDVAALTIREEQHGH